METLKKAFPHVRETVCFICFFSFLHAHAHTHAHASLFLKWGSPRKVLLRPDGGVSRAAGHRRVYSQPRVHTGVSVLGAPHPRKSPVWAGVRPRCFANVSTPLPLQKAVPVPAGCPCPAVVVRTLMGTHETVCVSTLALPHSRGCETKDGLIRRKSAQEA